MDFIRFERDALRDPAFSLSREWLVADGNGAYASGSVAGARTRRYHALLTAALNAPLGRVVTVAQCLERVTLPDGRATSLHVEEGEGGEVRGDGLAHLEGFRLDGTLPVWTFDAFGARVERRVFMAREANTTFVTYTLLAGGPIELEVTPLCALRDHHALRRRDAAVEPRVDAMADGLRVAFPGSAPVFVRASTGRVRAGGEWHAAQFLRVEDERGFDREEDLFAAGAIAARLEPGGTLAVAVTMDANAFAASWRDALDAARDREAALLDTGGFERAPAWVRQLVLAADQFVVRRGAGATVLAGYPWFSDWGRDTMIALPGLAVATGRPELAASVLRTFARHVDRGMIPNRFPDEGEAPEYNTVDATLWFFQALGAYEAATGDASLVDELWPVLEDVIAWHVRGTRYGIGVDAADGLLRQGEPGAQLTWMDVRIGDWVVTPRHGKPVEVNALWVSALARMTRWSARRAARVDYGWFEARARSSFARFWNPARGYAFDVLDGPGGSDASVRPNAVIAASLEFAPFTVEQRRAVVNVATRELLTPRGLRSLAPLEAGFTARYEGGPERRDAAYHQGTVWAWLIGPFATACGAAFGAGAARAALEPLESHLFEAGVGSISEVFDAVAPFTPRGCPWQAWSVAEVLRAWRDAEARAGE